MSTVSGREEMECHESRIAAEDGRAQRFSADHARGDFAIEARFYQKLHNRQIKCGLCPRACFVGDGERGHCGVRENRGGTFLTLVHSRVCATHVDPIEKKPLFHYLPGTVAFSIATAGCNVSCKFCQNWNLSQSRPEQIHTHYAPPQRIVAIARRLKCPTIAYTYGEPVVFAEYLMDTADAGHGAGIRSIVVSNGYIQQDALRQAYGKMDAVKIDLKSFSESYYANIVGGQLKPVLDTLVTLRTMGKWTEIVYLVGPTLNDSDARVPRLSRNGSRFNLGPDVPLAFHAVSSRISSENLPVTPVKRWSAPRPSPMQKDFTLSISATSPAIPHKTHTARSAAK